MNRELLGADHPDIANIVWNLAVLQYDRGETRAALGSAHQALATWRKAFPHDHPRIAVALNVIGLWQALAGDFGEADRYLQEGLAMRRRLFGDGQPDMASSFVNLSILRSAERRYAEALQLAQDAQGISTRALSADHWRTAIAESAGGAALTGLGRYADAEAALTHSYAILKQDGGAPLTYRTLTRHYLDELHRREARPATAAANPAGTAR